MTTQGIEAGTGETRSGSIRQDESPVAESDAPDHPTATDWSTYQATHEALAPAQDFARACNEAAANLINGS